jgi:hypothetical protein
MVHDCMACICVTCESSSAALLFEIAVHREHDESDIVAEREAIDCTAVARFSACE